MLTLTLDDFKEVRARIAQHIKHTPLLTSRQLAERTGFDVRLKAERVGSYKIRGPLNKFALMPEEQKKRASFARRRAITRRAWHSPRRSTAFARSCAWRKTRA